MNSAEMAPGGPRGDEGGGAAVGAGGRPEPAGGPGGRHVIAFGSLTALEGETLEACVERHGRALAGGRPSQRP